MKKLVFFDIDGTLLPEGEKTINEDVINEVKSIMDENTTVFICTGRCYHQAKQYIDALGCDSYVCSNGQEVCYEGEIIYQCNLENGQIDKITKTIESFDCGWGYETRKSIFLPENEYAVELQNVLSGYGFQDITVCNESLKTGVYQVWAFAEPQQILDVIKALKSDFTIYSWNEKCAEILPKGESKANGILKIKNILENTGHQVKTIAFGDGVNDIDMFKYCDVAVVMDNATDDVKQYADIITTDCRDNGIKNGLVLAGLK